MKTTTFWKKHVPQYFLNLLVKIESIDQGCWKMSKISFLFTGEAHKLQKQKCTPFYETPCRILVWKPRGLYSKCRFADIFVEDCRQKNNKIHKHESDPEDDSCFKAILLEYYVKYIIIYLSPNTGQKPKITHVTRQIKVETCLES